MLTLTQGDTRPLTGRCDLRDLSTSVATAADLRLATRLEVRIARPGKTALITRDGTVLDGAAGTWSMAWLATDADVVTPGVYLVETEAFFTGYSVTFGRDQFRIRPSL